MNYVGSSAYVIQANPSSSGGRRPFCYADKIDLSKPALVVLGGALTTTESKAFGYIEHLAKTTRNKTNINFQTATISVLPCKLRFIILEQLILCW